MSKLNRRPLSGWLIVISVAVMVAGCETAPKRETIEMKALLADSGFLLQHADTPEELDNIRSLEQLKLVRHERYGRVRYTYADAEGCKCMYVGNEETYQQFQRLVRQRLPSGKRPESARKREDDAPLHQWGLRNDWDDPWPQSR